MPYCPDPRILIAFPNARQVKPKTPIQRVIRWYEKNGEELHGEEYLFNTTLPTLQKLFDIESINPMYDCYPLESREQQKYFSNLLNVQFDTDNYEYFLECDSI